MFPNGDNLHNVVLPEEKVTKNTKTLNSNFSDEVKMVQCNGARRNLNLKLSSPHNLRARAKHESGHLLRSKGSPWHEDKSDKFYDKLEGFTIKKRAKGTIWIEEEDPDDKYAEDIIKEPKQEDYKIKPFSKDVDGVYHANNKDDNISNKHSNPEPPNLQQTLVHNNAAQNGVISSRCISEDPDYLKCKDERNGDENAGPLKCTINENGIVDNSYITFVCRKQCKYESCCRENCALQTEKVMAAEARKFSNDAPRIDATGVTCNVSNGQKELNASTQAENTRHEKPRHHPRANRRGGRNIRGRHRLSVEERLIEDNRAYYKVEVLGNKLRSSAVPGGGGGGLQHSPSKDGDDEEKKDDAPSSEKPVVVRFKRVRKSELSLLSDEAESFMFGEAKRDDSSETSDGEQSSVLPRDTESSEGNETGNSSLLSSSPLISSPPVKQEIVEEDSQDSVHLGRVRRRRRTQAEAFIKDNADYYKFETPGSRLRYQAPLTGIKDYADGERGGKKSSAELEDGDRSSQALSGDDIVEKIYPSKPSAEIEKMQFSFEAIPKSEPWYQTYQRQDTGAEFWHCFSEDDSMKPFLLPYEIENFHEILLRSLSGRVDGKKRGRGRGIGCAGRSPRKSPRCHASTLAIMSTIIRKREQQSSSTLYTIEESPVARSCANTTVKLEQKQDSKSDMDEELRDMVKTIDEMLNTKGTLELDNSFEPDEQMLQNDLYDSNVPKGAPPNLLELLDNCHDMTNCLENSSCASSECGENNSECLLKRRKKRRKNRTGWPGNKMKKKLQQSNAIGKTDVAGGGQKIVLTQKRLSLSAMELGNSTERYNALNGLSEENGLCAVPSGAERLGVSSKSSVDVLGSISHACNEGYTSVKSAKTSNDAGLPSVGSYTAESPVVLEKVICDAQDKYSSGKDSSYKKESSEFEEVSENDPGNDENHLSFRKDVANALSISERNFVAKLPIRKRMQREHAVATAAVAVAVDSAAELPCAESRTEIENQDNSLCRKDTETGIVPRKYHNNELSPKQRQQQRRGNSENADSATEQLPLLGERHRHGVLYRRRRVGSRKRFTRKRQSRPPPQPPPPPPPAATNLSSSDVMSKALYEDENCKKDSYLSITCKKHQQQATARANLKRKSEAVSSESIQESDVESPLSERITPPASSDLEQRRANIDFQPVVRMMKIDDQVDMDHSNVLSVTIASNRRLRSASSPRSNATKPVRKRLKSGRGHFGRWLKNS